MIASAPLRRTLPRRAVGPAAETQQVAPVSPAVTPSGRGGTRRRMTGDATRLCSRARFRKRRSP